MGKFVEEKNLIENYVNSYTKTTTEFSRFIEGNPTFVTFYNRDKDASTQDVTLNGVYEHIGADSPVKYHKIENLPIYGVEELLPSINYDETTGLSTEIESTCVILPNTIKPLSSDYFSINSLNKDYLFRISNVEQNTLNNNSKMYKCTFFFVTDRPSLIDEQVTENYKVVFENIGKNQRSIIKESDFLLANKLDDIMENLKEQYVLAFYNKHYNTFLFNNEIYDNELITFISNHNLFIKTKTFMKNILVTPFQKSFESIKEYQNSIYTNIENNKLLDSERIVHFSSNINKENSLFKYYQNLYTVKRTYRYKFNLDQDLNNITNNYIEDLSNSEQLNNYLKFIYLYFIDELDYKDLCDTFENFYINDQYEDFLYVPVMIFIISNFINKNIMNK